MTTRESVQVLAPAATKITLLPPPPSRVQSGVIGRDQLRVQSGVVGREQLRVQSGVVGRGQLRVPRSVQLQLSRSLTFGVLGEDSNLYPSSKWVSENRDTFAGRKSEEPTQKADFVITSLDTRKHNPQPTQIFHIRRINKKPVCNVQSWVSTGEPEKTQTESSVYRVSFKERPAVPVHIVHKEDKDKPIEGIVPVNISGSKFDVRAEMMLPVCDPTNMPSAHNPHRYLLRKRKVPPPFNTHTTTYTSTATSGIIYPNLEHSRMTSYQPGMIPTGSLPFPNEKGESSVPKEVNDRTSVSSLSGQDFSRRRFIEPPQSHIFCEPRAGSPVCVSSLAGKKFSRRRKIEHPVPEIKLGFNGGIAETSSARFDDKYLPFIRAKTII